MSKMQPTIMPTVNTPYIDTTFQTVCDGTENINVFSPIKISTNFNIVNQYTSEMYMWVSAVNTELARLNEFQHWVAQNKPEVITEYLAVGHAMEKMG